MITIGLFQSNSNKFWLKSIYFWSKWSIYTLFSIKMSKILDYRITNMLLDRKSIKMELFLIFLSVFLIQLIVDFNNSIAVLKRFNQIHPYNSNYDNKFWSYFFILIWFYYDLDQLKSPSRSYRLSLIEGERIHTTNNQSVNVQLTPYTWLGGLINNSI